MKKLLSSIFFLSSSNIFSSIIGVVRNKLIAVLLGPEGVGLFSQLQQIQSTASNTLPMGMLFGTTKYFAKYRNTDRKLLITYIKSSSRTFLTVSLTAMVLGLIFIVPLASMTLHDKKMYLYLVPIFISVPFLMQTLLYLSYLRAGMEMKIFSWITVLTAIVGIFFAVPFILIWKLFGAAIYLLVVSVIGYFIARYYANKSMGKELLIDIKNAKFDFAVVKTLMRFTIGNLPMSLIDNFTPLIVRSKIISDLGLIANGIYQVPFIISCQYLTMPLNAIGTYSFSRISQVDDPKEVNTVVNDCLKIALLTCTFGILGVMLFRDAFINILFSKKFAPALELMSWQLIGDFFRCVATVIQYPTLPQECFRARNIANLTKAAIFFAVFLSLPVELRLKGAIWANGLSWIFYMIAMYVYTNKKNGFKFTSSNWRLFSISLIAVLIAAAFPVSELKWRLASLAVLIIWTLTAVSHQDFLKLVSAIKERTKKQ